MSFPGYCNTTEALFVSQPFESQVTIFITFPLNSLANPQADVVLAAEELRQAAGALGRITGRVDVEEVLEVVFREFCIGK